MNKTIIITVACIVLMAMQACVGMSAKSVVIPSDRNISRNVMPESSFSAIELNGPIDVVYRNGNSREVRIDGPDNVVPLVETTVSGGKLAIKYKDNTRITEDADVTVYVTAPDVAGFVVNGSGGISIKSAIDIPGRDAVMTVNGSGDINAVAVTCKSFKSVVNGSGDIDINSRVKATQNLNMAANGSGNIEVDAIECRQGKASVNGSGDVSVDAAKVSTLDVSVNGSGDVECNEIDATTVKAELSGSGDIAIDGRAENADLTVNTSGDISAENLQADNVKATVKGSGEINCYAMKTLDATINGSGEVRYGGSPQVTSHGNNSDNISRN